jgi:hypothetical protein
MDVLVRINVTDADQRYPTRDPAMCEKISAF